ncbi:hypothetical protein SAMN05421788_10662 [Filimonas lacunae]|uniref:Adhesin n=1 Tax=Filimonas lacunae TaxID=477680 RepID=A0A173MEX8_9BACT|nr:hypothetical protein [Filimonas lacunae]BAV05988.1 hypothetical protein FLA_2003 [Filimonas lacunae]SIT24069.1 hypothetical protein SAMN05421788_10662 [Filimonas lacunae]
MAAFENTKTRSREELKKHFRNGEIPSEDHFCTLIDSMINKQDDGFSKDDDNGMIIASTMHSGRFMALYRNIDDLDPFFVFERDEKEKTALKLSPVALQDARKEKKEDDTFYFHGNGSLGLGKHCNEDFKLDVKGFAGMEGRAGTYKQGSVKADGQWHPIATNLDNCQAFEVVARTGRKASGRFAIMHAIALSAFGKSSSNIRRTGAHYGFFWNKIKLRWRSNGTHDFRLEIKTSSNYGNGVQIYYNITRLWDDTKFLPDTYYY